MSEIDKYLKEYNEGQSIIQIAKKYNTYPNKIRRMFIKAGIPLRDKSEAQKLALEKGVSIHPTKGTKRSEETKIKISDKVSDQWKNLSNKELTKRKEKAKELWDQKPQHVKDQMFKSAAQAVAKAGREGSKIEKFLISGLMKAGYNVIPHKESLVLNTNLQIDLFIPELKLAIEIDGPSHFLPIWGEEKLKQRIAMDKDKNGLLIQGGYSIIRVKCLIKNMTGKKSRTVLDFILNEMEKHKGCGIFYSEIEVK